MITASHTIIDSHVHLWNRERFDYDWLNSQAPALQGDFLLSDLAVAQASATGVYFSGSVFVQADCRSDQSVAEAAWVQECADAGAPIVAVVAAAQLERGAHAATQLEELAELPLVVGVRRLLQDEPVGFATGDDFVTGVRLLADHAFTMDLCIREWQLPEVAALAARCPEVTFVLDHLGKPTVSTSAFGTWARDLGRLAALPNVRCKLSGIASEAPPGVAQCRRVIAVAASRDRGVWSRPMHVWQRLARAHRSNDVSRLADGGDAGDRLLAFSRPSARAQ